MAIVFVQRRLLCAGLLIWAFGLACPAQAEEPLKPALPYREGPLTKADFLGERPATATTTAWSEFEYKWNYDFRVELKNGVHTLRVTSLDIWAEFRRDKSWNQHPGDPVLLDHEQGHFDIAQAAALSALVKLTPHNAKNAPIMARHKKLETAQVQLENTVNATIQTLTKEAKQQHIDYDKETSSGVRVRAQALARKAQREHLQMLIDELASQPKK